jgi:hypothetical protein
MDNSFFTCFSRNPFILLHPLIIEIHPTNVTIPDFYNKHCSTTCMSLSVLPTILQLAIIHLALDLVNLLVLTVMMEVASPAVLVLCFATLYSPCTVFVVGLDGTLRRSRWPIWVISSISIMMVMNVLMKNQGVASKT